MEPRMRKACVWGFVCGSVFVYLLVGAGVIGASPVLERPDLESFLDRVVAEQMEQFQIANAAVSVVGAADVAAVKGYGYKDVERQVPVDGRTTLFRIGSTSKLFTWTAVMQIVE